MRKYCVKFMKNIPDDTGHEHSMCQREFEIEAGSEAEAIEQAKALFSTAEHSGDWSLRADTIEVDAI